MHSMDVACLPWLLAFRLTWPHLPDLLAAVHSVQLQLHELPAGGSLTAAADELPAGGCCMALKGCYLLLCRSTSTQLASFCELHLPFVSAACRLQVSWPLPPLHMSAAAATLSFFLTFVPALSPGVMLHLLLQHACSTHLFLSLRWQAACLARAAPLTVCRGCLQVGDCHAHGELSFWPH